METLFLESITKQFFDELGLAEHIAIVLMEVMTIH